MNARLFVFNVNECNRGDVSGFEVPASEHTHIHLPRLALKDGNA